MKKIILITFAIFVTLIPSVFGQNNELRSASNEQMISMIDKIVLEIQNEKSTYRKIISETDSLLNSKYQPSNITECVYKKDKEIKIVQISDKNKKDITDYYINNGKLVYVETKNNDNTIDKSYYNLSLGYLIASYKNEKEIKYTNEEKMKIGLATQESIEKLIKRYKNK